MPNGKWHLATVLHKLDASIGAALSVKGSSIGDGLPAGRRGAELFECLRVIGLESCCLRVGCKTLMASPQVAQARYRNYNENIENRNVSYVVETAYLPGRKCLFQEVKLQEPLPYGNCTSSIWQTSLWVVS